MSNTFCILPFIHLEARADSMVSPCCMSQEFFRKDNGDLFSLSVDTLSDVWQSNSLKKLRQTLIDGKQATACSVCYMEESHGIQSKRIRENLRWGVSDSTTLVNTELKSLDLKLGNTCNLKCRICTPGSSSLWIKEDKEVNGYSVLEHIAINIKSEVTPRMVMQWPENNSKFWNDLEHLLPTVEMFEIYGGEPFLSKQHFELLRHSSALGYSSNQKVHYNSNGTIYPEDAITNIWPKFKRVDVMLSIDGIGNQFEYQRHPAKWSQVEENLIRFKESLGSDLEICLTVSAINIFYVPEYIEYFERMGVKVWLNTLYHPSKFCIANLPVKAKNAVRHKLSGYTSSALIEPIQPILDFMMKDNFDMSAEFWKTITAHDKYRNENYEMIFPEFYTILHDSI